jgi:peptide/nickel transport system permease protein
MRAYVIRRILLIPVTVIIVSIIVFLLVRFIPGDVIDLIQSEMEQMSGVSGVDRGEVERRLGLDKPVWEQYINWIGDIILHGDLGTSMRADKSVGAEIFARVPVTFELAILAMIIGGIISIPIGVFSAIRQDTGWDYFFRTIAILLISIPTFWTATMVIIYPSIWWGWSPPMEVIPFFENPAGNLQMFVLPAVIMGTALTGGVMRMMRTMMLEVMRQDYTRTAWAKGLSERTVITRHALKNALIPVITIMGMMLPILIGGSVIIEQIFVLPGLGRLMLESLSQRDYTMISGINLIIATFVIIINLVVDLTYAWFDPRIRFRRSI